MFRDTPPPWPTRRRPPPPKRPFDEWTWAGALICALSAAGICAGLWKLGTFLAG